MFFLLRTFVDYKYLDQLKNVYVVHNDVISGISLLNPDTNRYCTFNFP